MGKKHNLKIYSDVEVIDINSKGKGVVKTEDGKVIFVNGVVPGDIIKTEIFKKRRGYFEGNLIDITKLSNDRIKAVCEHFGSCGGCKLQNLNYMAQLKHKQKEINFNLKKKSGMDITIF